MFRYSIHFCKWSQCLGPREKCLVWSKLPKLLKAAANKVPSPSVRVTPRPDRAVTTRSKFGVMVRHGHLAHFLTSLALAASLAPGLVMSAEPLHTMAASSVNGQQGSASSGGSSITSSPSSRSSRTYASCWRRAASRSSDPDSESKDCGTRHTMA